ncbi:MAG TPA: TonB-dependent receptor, partial [Myxococcota bacterium]
AQLRDELTYRSGGTRVVGGLDATARDDAFTYGGLFANSDVRELPAVDLEAFTKNERVRESVSRVTAALYLEGTIEPLEGVTLTPGLRIESYFLNGEPHVSFEPRFAGGWQITSGDYGTMLKVAAGATSRPPDPDELAQAVLEGFTLAPQTALDVQGGFDQDLGGMATFSTTLFSTWRANLTTRSALFPLPERLGERAVYDGASENSYGLEALVRGGVPGKWFAWLTYSLTRSEKLDGTSPYAIPYAYKAPDDTTHLLGVLGQTYLPWGFRLGGRYRIATGMPDDEVAGALFDADTGRYEAVPAPKDLASFPLFQSLDVRVDWETTLDWFRLDLYADLANVNTVLGRPVEGTFYNFDFSQTSPHLGLPLIPAIGAKAIF